MTSGTGMEVAAAVVKLLRIRYFWGEKYESSVTQLGTCITAAAIDDISLSLSPTPQGSTFLNREGHAK